MIGIICAVLLVPPVEANPWPNIELQSYKVQQFGRVFEIEQGETWKGNGVIYSPDKIVIFWRFDAGGYHRNAVGMYARQPNGDLVGRRGWEAWWDEGELHGHLSPDRLTR